MVHTSHPELLGLGFRAYLPARITACEIRVESFEGFKGLGLRVCGFRAFTKTDRVQGGEVGIEGFEAFFRVEGGL